MKQIKHRNPLQPHMSRKAGIPIPAFFFLLFTVFLLGLAPGRKLEGISQGLGLSSAVWAGFEEEALSPEGGPTITAAPKPTKAPAHAHTWSEEYTMDKEPTCTRKGKKSIYCLTCGKRKPKSIVSIDSLGHDFSDWEVIQEPTVFEKGRKVCTCTRCGKTKEKNIPKEKKLLALSLDGLVLENGALSPLVKVVQTAKGDSLQEVLVKEAYLELASLDRKTGAFSVKAHKKGRTTIRVRLKSGKTKSLKVTITPKRTSTIRLAENVIYLFRDKTLDQNIFQLSPILTPADSDEKVVYKSSDPKVVRVTQKGKITALKTGQAVITLQSGSACCECRVVVQ